MISELCDPSIIPTSSIPIVVIVCGVSQFSFVKVIDPGFTVTSVSSPEVTERTTSSVGSASRTIVNVSVVPDSSTSVDPSVSTMVNPATSSSVVVAETVSSAKSSKLSFEFASSTATVIVLVMVPSMMSSSTPVTVTVCGVSQSAEVKVTDAGTVASPVSSDEMVRTTSEVGSASRTTVNVSVVPDSSTSVDPSVSTIVNPATSSSVVVAETV